MMIEPTTVSARLRYAPFTSTDIADCFRYYQNDDCMRYITGKGISEEQAVVKFHNILKVNKAHPGIGFFKVENRENGLFAGIAKLTMLNDTQAEAGYGLLPEFWGQGYASEILAHLTGLAQHLPGVTELVGIINPMNTASKNVLLKQGFELFDTGFEQGNLCAYYRVAI